MDASLIGRGTASRIPRLSAALAAAALTRVPPAAATAVRDGWVGGLHGSLALDPVWPAGVRVERRSIGSCSIVRLRADARFDLRRTWSNVREDRADVAVLCFVRRGCLRMGHPRGESLAGAGDLLIACSTAPFRIGNVSATCDLLQLTVPVHRLRAVLCRDVVSGMCLSAASRPFRLAERILTDLIEDAGELPGHAAAQLVDVVLAVLGDAIKGCHASTGASRSLAHRRTDDVLRYVDRHLSDPQLSAAGVARACGISPRYLSALLRRNRTPFAELVWTKRLEAAARWLATSKADEASVSEIAYRVGFKSHAHFSRMFRRRFNTSPTQYRAAAARRQ